MSTLPASPSRSSLTSPAPVPPEAACPVCGQDNQCAMAQASEVADCWCMHTHIDQAILASLPIAERGKRCICPACARSPEHRGEDGGDSAGGAL